MPMQFHLNGFRPGDPEISEPAEHYDGPRSSGHLPAEVDVLIIGCGPAGLTLSSRTGENPPYGMIGRIEETSASFEARSAPRSHPTITSFRQRRLTHCERFIRSLRGPAPAPTSFVGGAGARPDHSITGSRDRLAKRAPILLPSACRCPGAARGRFGGDLSVPLLGIDRRIKESLFQAVLARVLWRDAF